MSILLTSTPLLKYPIAQNTLRLLSLLTVWMQHNTTGFVKLIWIIVYLLLTATVVSIITISLRGKPQITSEIFRTWIIIGVAWFFLMRGQALFKLILFNNIVKFIIPLLFITIVAIIGLMLTGDLGPMLVMLYAAGIFIGAAVAFWLDHHQFKISVASVGGILVTGVWLVIVTLMLFSIGSSINSTTAARLEAVRDPFSANNDQAAILRWFQQSVPTEGYGFTHIPWCGKAMTEKSCNGVPRQIQSDYTYTSLVGVFGYWKAIGIAISYLVWLLLLIRPHTEITTGVLEFNSTDQSKLQNWLVWIALCWITLTLSQSVITIVVNLGWLPITGITFPFMSYGISSLLINTVFLGLVINIPQQGY